MITPTIDVGQILISVLLALATIVGWFIKRDIQELGKRLDKHDVILFDMTATVNRLLGLYEATNRVVGPLIRTREAEK